MMQAGPPRGGRHAPFAALAVAVLAMGVALAQAPTTISGRVVTGLIAQASPGSTIAGRVTFDTYSNSTPPAPSALEIAPLPVNCDLAPLNHASAEAHADWTFEMKGINGPRRLEVTRVPPGWALKEIRVNGADATDRPLPFGRPNQSLTDVEVVLSDRINTISGTVADDRGQFAPGSSVIIFSADRGRWYTRRGINALSPPARAACSRSRA